MVCLTSPLISTNCLIPKQSKITYFWSLRRMLSDLTRPDLSPPRACLSLLSWQPFSNRLRMLAKFTAKLSNCSSTMELAVIRYKTRQLAKVWSSGSDECHRFIWLHDILEMNTNTSGVRFLSFVRAVDNYWHTLALGCESDRVTDPIDSTDNAICNVYFERVAQLSQLSRLWQLLEIECGRSANNGLTNSTKHIYTNDTGPEMGSQFWFSLIQIGVNWALNVWLAVLVPLLVLHCSATGLYTVHTVHTVLHCSAIENSRLDLHLTTSGGNSWGVFSHIIISYFFGRPLK